MPYLRAVPEPGEYGDNSWTKTLTLDELTALLQAKGENIGTAKDIVITKLSTGGRVHKRYKNADEGSHSDLFFLCLRHTAEQDVYN